MFVTAPFTPQKMAMVAAMTTLLIRNRGFGPSLLSRLKVLTLSPSSREGQNLTDRTVAPPENREASQERLVRRAGGDAARALEGRTGLLVAEEGPDQTETAGRPASDSPTHVMRP